MYTMTNVGIATVFVVLSGLGWWFFGGSPSKSGPKSMGDIAKLLKAQGCRAKDIGCKDNGFEVDAYINGSGLKMSMDKMGGNIIKIHSDQT